MTDAPSARQAAVPVAVVATVIFLTAIAPLATDMYVPAFPRAAHDLGVGAAPVQLTLTTFFVGMGLGQLVGGPVSDQRGRRRLLLASILVACAGSIGCAVAPSIAVLTAARLVQGFSGGWAMVIGRAVIVDLARGVQLVRVLNVISGVGGVAPIVGPLLGAAIIQFSGVAHVVLGRRRAGGRDGLLRSASRTGIVASVATSCRWTASLPAGESRGAGAPDVRRVRHGERLGDGLAVRLRRDVRVHPRVDERPEPDRLLGRLRGERRRDDGSGPGVGTARRSRLHPSADPGRPAARPRVGLVMLAGAVWARTPLLLALACFFGLMAAQGLVGPNGGALASASVPDHPGTGSAVLGMLQWVAAGTVAPIAGLGGATTAVPMALLMVAGAAVSLVGLLVVARPHPTPTLPVRCLQLSSPTQ